MIKQFYRVTSERKHDLIGNLLVPKLPLDCELEMLIETLENHFKPIFINERYQFHKKSQQLTKSVAVFNAEFHWLATHSSGGQEVMDGDTRFQCHSLFYPPPFLNPDVKTKTRLFYPPPPYKSSPVKKKTAPPFLPPTDKIKYILFPPGHHCRLLPCLRKAKSESCINHPDKAGN